MARRKNRQSRQKQSGGQNFPATQKDLGINIEKGKGMGTNR